MRELTIAGERIVLLAGRALWWPACGTLLVADGYRVRLPCFAFGPADGSPPAFGACTRHMSVEPDPDMRGFVATPGRVFEVPHAATRRRRKA